MNYDEIKDTALKYSMRTDQDTADRIDSFIKIVEARMNRTLNLRYMSKRARLSLTPGTNYYAMPDYMLSIRDIQINRADGSVDTLVYVNPETMNSPELLPSGSAVYTFINKQLQVYPVNEGDILEVVYYKKIDPLAPDNQNTEMSVHAPNIYIFGILVEISAYSKDYEASQMWEQRYLAAIAEIQAEDDQAQWSGTPLRIRMA